eukprot:Nk52_evm1s1236 gene=Nk52_evmTU1s1236
MSARMSDYWPSLADKNSTGFFKQDATSQTDSHEILDLKDMISLFRLLRTELYELKHSLKISSSAIKVDYDKKMKDRVIQLYCRINSKISGVEKTLGGRINQIRAGCRSQLHDAIAKITGEHQIQVKNLLSDLTTKRQEELQAVSKEIARLKRMIHERDDIIMKLRADGLTTPPTEEDDINPELMAYQLTDMRGPEINAMDLVAENTNPLNGLNIVSEREKELEEENARLKERIKDLENLLEAKEGHASRMEKKLAEMSEYVQFGMDEIQSLKEKLSQAEKLAKESKERADKLQNQTPPPQVVQQTVVTEINTDALKKLEKYYMEKIGEMEYLHAFEKERLQTELAKLSKVWEKKLLMTQQSLHAIKDESYLRTMLQRQSAILQYASLIYPKMEYPDPARDVASGGALPKLGGVQARPHTSGPILQGFKSPASINKGSAPVDPVFWRKHIVKGAKRIGNISDKLLRDGITIAPGSIQGQRFFHAPIPSAMVDPGKASANTQLDLPATAFKDGIHDIVEEEIM